MRSFRSFSTPPTLHHNHNRAAVAVKSAFLYVLFPLSEPGWGEEPTRAGTSLALCKILIQKKENNINMKPQTCTNGAGTQSGVVLKEEDIDVSHCSPDLNPI